LKTALVFNLITEEMLKSLPLDYVAEYDSHETVNALKNALLSGGHEVLLIEADDNIYDNLRKNKKHIDIVFNIAEGLRGESRESFVPLICETLEIPYTGSGPLTLSICLNKAKTKEILSYYSITTPNFQVINNMDDPVNNSLKFPLILKLNEDGSSKGLDYDSVVYDTAELSKRVRLLTEKYDTGILVEEYIDGREFTIPLIMNNPPVVLPIVEVVFDKVPQGKPKINLFVPDDPIVEMLKKHKPETEIRQSNHSRVCPADIDKDMEKTLNSLALKAYLALNCKDWCRMEFRVDKDNNPYLLELNPIAGIDPSYHFPLSAKVYGLNYNQLINKILDSACERYGLR